MKALILFSLLLLVESVVAQDITKSHYPLAISGIRKGNGKYSGFTPDQRQPNLSQAQQCPQPLKTVRNPEQYKVITLAGQPMAGNADGHGLTASLSSPSRIVIDSKGNLFVADATNNKIRKIAPNGLVTTFAGSQTPGKKDGPVGEASFFYPTGLAIDTKGNLYVADKGNHVIRKISPTGIVSTLAGSGQRNSIDGQGKLAGFDKPVAVAVDTAGNVYVADAANHKIRKITPAGVVSTLAGSGELGSQDGKGAAASFYSPAGVAVDKTGNVYVADHDNNRIRKIAPDGVVSTVAGGDTVGNTDGSIAQASFFYPSDVAIDTIGNLYITDQVNHKVRKLSIEGEVTTLAGNGVAGAVDGNGASASFNYPSGIAIDGAGNIYVADQLNCKIRKIIPL